MREQIIDGKNDTGQIETLNVNEKNRIQQRKLKKELLVTGLKINQKTYCRKKN